MTVGDAGMTVGDAGMTVGDAGMTVGDAGMTDPVCVVAQRGVAYPLLWIAGQVRNDGSGFFLRPNVAEPRMITPTPSTAMKITQD